MVIAVKYVAESQLIFRHLSTLCIPTEKGNSCKEFHTDRTQ